MNDGAMRQYYPPMAGDEERGQPDRPDYKVYRSRPGLFGRLRSPDLSKLRERARRKTSGEKGDRADRGAPGARPPWRRALKWVGIVALVWLAISFVAFEVSSQIQKWKLRDMGDTLHGNPFLAVSPQTILVIGTDIRSGQFAGPAEADTQSCLEQVESGTFRKLSIPRDALANIPGHSENKINSAYASGGATLTVRTVEEFLGINVDQVAIVDFDGFRKFIDTIGGVKVNLPVDVCSSVSGGAFNLKLSKGEHTLNGFQAITLARTRENTCGSGQFSGTDIERTEFQQLIIDGIKDRLTDPLRLPYNFIKGPFIAWNAPKVMVSSMGAGTMPQLVFAAAIGGGGGTDVLKPTGTTAAGNLIIPQTECQRAVKQFLGKSPPHAPACSPPS